VYLDVVGGVGRELDDKTVRLPVGDVRFGPGRSTEQGLGLELHDGLRAHTKHHVVAIQISLLYQCLVFPLPLQSTHVGPEGVVGEGLALLQPDVRRGRIGGQQSVVLPSALLNTQPLPARRGDTHNTPFFKLSPEGKALGWV
jgi:hypothetical protein